MPPAVIAVVLVAIAVPAAFRAVTGRPRELAAACVASGAAVLLAQAAGELSGTRVGMLGDAQVALAGGGAALASLAVAAAETRRRSRGDR